MAHGTSYRRQSSTCSPCRQKAPLSINTLRLSTAKPFGSNCGQPIGFGNEEKAELAEVELARRTKLRSRSDVLSRSPQNQNNGHRLEFRGQELINMPLKTQGNDISNPANPKRHTGPATSSISGSPLLSKAPPRQDSSYFSTQPDSDNESTKAAEARVLTIYRKKVRRTKRVTWDRRGELTDLRKAFQDVADAFVQQVNRAVAFNNIREELEPYQERIRDAQDTLAAAENTYDELEKRLRREEDELEREEIRFYGYSESPTSSDLDADVSPIKETELQPTTHPEDDLKQVYLQKVSEAHYLREDLDNLEEDYYRFSTEAELRHKLGIRTSAETTEFCSAYRQRHTDIIGELERVETHLPSLRFECLKRGLFNEDEHIYKPHDALYEDIMDSIDEALERYPLRLAETQRHHPRRLDYENKTDYVNNWLLDWVESSSYECSVLKEWIISTYRTSIGHASELDHRWSDLALQNWNTDSAGIDANNHNEASMLDVITGDTGKLNKKIGIVNASRSISTGSSLDLDDLSRIGSLLTSSDDFPWVNRNPSTPGIRRMKRPISFWDLE